MNGFMELASFKLGARENKTGDGIVHEGDEDVGLIV